MLNKKDTNSNTNSNTNETFPVSVNVFSRNPNKEYNGYKNWQTWNVSLWLDNDESLSSHRDEITQQLQEDDEIWTCAMVQELISMLWEQNGTTLTPDMNVVDALAVDVEDLRDIWNNDLECN